MATDRIVGIDLGTTNSLVAFMQGDTPVVIPGDDGLNLLPSVVALDANNQPVIGNAARNSRIISWLSALCTAGRFIQTHAAGPRLSISTVASAIQPLTS